MRTRLPYFPHDQLAGPSPNQELAADVCELAAFFDANGQFLLSDLRNDLEIGGDEYEDVHDHNETSDAAIDAAARVIETRARLLDSAYPFELDEYGSALSFQGADTWAQHAYMMCLVLSHLNAITPVLSQASLEPSPKHVAQLRNWFQQIAAPALAAEIRGIAWAFGSPRSDKSPFLEKLKAIWAEIGDGRVREVPHAGSPSHVKDDEIDVIAARPHPDKMPGFPIVLAQAATGRDWASKSIKTALDYRFFPEWFDDQPASQVIAFHLIPFAVDAESMTRSTRTLGHIIHRLRLVGLLAEAELAIGKKTIRAEGVEAFASLADWLNSFREGSDANAA